VAPPTAIPSLSLHDALPISPGRRLARIGLRLLAAALPARAQECARNDRGDRRALAARIRTVALAAGAARIARGADRASPAGGGRSEEHTSELQSRENLVCRL